MEIKVAKFGGTSLADADEKSDAMGKAVLAMVDSMK